MSKISLREKRAVFATLTTMIKLFRFLQIHLALAICDHVDYGIRNKADGSNYTLKYSNFFYSAFSSIQFPLQLDTSFSLQNAQRRWNVVLYRRPRHKGVYGRLFAEFA